MLCAVVSLHTKALIIRTIVAEIERQDVVESKSQRLRRG